MMLVFGWFIFNASEYSLLPIFFHFGRRRETLIGIMICTLVVRYVYCVTIVDKLFKMKIAIPIHAVRLVSVAAAIPESHADARHCSP